MSFFNNLTTKAKNFATEGWYFVSSKIFIKNFSMILGIVIFVSVLLFWWLGCYTHHGEKISVPVVTNMTYKKAEAILYDKGLDIFVSDSIYKVGVAPGTILTQEPKPDEKVKRGRQIYVTISAYTPPVHNITPSYVGKSIDEVRRILTRQNYIVDAKPIVGDPRYKDVVQEIQVNGKTIFKYGDTNGKQDVKLQEQTKITILYIDGPGDELDIPNLVGQPYEAAKLNIISNHLNLGVVTADNTVMSQADSLVAFVVKQRPQRDQFKQKMHKGEAVDLWISKDNTPLDKMPIYNEMNKGADQNAPQNPIKPGE